MSVQDGIGDLIAHLIYEKQVKEISLHVKFMNETLVRLLMYTQSHGEHAGRELLFKAKYLDVLRLRTPM
jgi:hypothetical protein